MPPLAGVDCRGVVVVEKTAINPDHGLAQELVEEDQARSGSGQDPIPEKLTRYQRCSEAHCVG